MPRYFNPRLREGGDERNCQKRRNKRISIHASEKEATTQGGIPDSTIIDFNPRLREGGDLLYPNILDTLLYFNPRLREGGDCNIL